MRPEHVIPSRFESFALKDNGVLLSCVDDDKGTVSVWSLSLSAY